MKFDKTSQQFFDAMYQANPDPWSFEASAYELERYRIIVEALAHQRYQNVYEPGCSIGILTEKLALLADSVQAFDISSFAVNAALSRCAALQNVSIVCGKLQNTVPLVNTNLLVLSEVGYYFTAVELDDIIKNIIHHCTQPLTILASHWQGNSVDHLLSGTVVNEIIGSQPGLIHEYRYRHPGFCLDRWRLDQ